MKKFLIAIAVAVSVAASSQAWAQSNGVGQVVWDALTSGATNWFATVDGIYASNSKQFGGEAALVYKLNDYTLVGPRIIYFEKGLYIGTVNLTLQAPFKPFKSVQWLTLTPLGDVGSGYDSKTGTMLGIAEGGGAVRITGPKNGRWELGLIGLYGKYTTISGGVITAGPYLNINF